MAWKIKKKKGKNDVMCFDSQDAQNGFGYIVFVTSFYYEITGRGKKRGLIIPEEPKISLDQDLQNFL